MDERRQTMMTKAIPWLSNGLVLATLATIGWWGHTHHWSMPRFSQLFGRSEPAATPEDATATDAADRQHRAPPGVMPVIEFASAEAAHDCGIEIQTADQRSMDDTVSATGAVGYDQTHLAQLAVRVPGTVWRVEKRVGDVVNRGEVLAIVDSAEVGQAKENMLEAAVLFNLKAQTLKRLSEIQSSLPPRDIREAEAAQELARAQRFNAVQKLVNLGFPLRVEDLDDLSTDALAAHLHMLGLSPSLERETNSANLIPLVAPFAGVITNCEVVQGELVEPSEPQYTIADVSRIWLNLDIRQEDASQVKLGTSVLFSTEGVPQPVTCTLTWIGTEVDPRTRMTKARAEGVNPFLDEKQAGPGARRLLQVGAFGSARILVGANPAAVVVPNNALRYQWEIGRQVLFLPDEENRTFTPRVVQKGLVRGDYVQILDGLKAGERVVTEGSRILSSELSDRLQQRIGDNADAVRGFDELPSARPGA